MRRKLKCELNDVAMGEKFCAFMRFPILTQCYQVALFAMQVENGLFVKAAVLQNILKITSNFFFKISLQIYMIVVRNKNNYIFSVSNAVDYTQKNYV